MVRQTSRQVGLEPIAEDQLHLMSGEVSKPHLEAPDGPVSPSSRFYIERSADRLALEAIKRQGVTITIRAPYQMGKTSLLSRLVNKASKEGKKVATLNFQSFDKSSLTHASTFFRQFCIWLSDELNIEDQTEDFWKRSLGNVQLCTHYISRYIFKETQMPLLIAIDDVNAIIDADFRSDFFDMIRSWHNRRSVSKQWSKVDIILATSTEPSLLISDIPISPFNIGGTVVLDDFTPEQISELNDRHGSVLTRDREQQLITILGGHPYLVRQALYLIASGRMSTGDMSTHTIADDGPFRDHLHILLLRLHHQPELIEGFRQILQNQNCSVDVYYRLHSTDLVRREGLNMTPRNQLYVMFFARHLLS